MTKKIGIYRDRRKQRRWVCRWFGWPDEVTGRRKRYAKSFEVRRQAESFAAELHTDFDSGKCRDRPRDVGVKEFAAEWLRIKRAEVRSETVLLYQDTIGRLIEYFGPSKPIGKISAKTAALFIAELSRRDGRPGVLSNWTRHRILRCCRTIFSDAVIWEHIAQNPFSKVKRPKLILGEWYRLSPAEFLRLQANVPLRRKALYALAYCAGLRRGELLGLRWEQLNLERGEVTIVNQKDSTSLPPFSIKDYEKRTIPLPASCIETLTDLRTYNSATDQTPYVLHNQRQYETLQRKWKRYQTQGQSWRNQDFQNNTLTVFKRDIKRAGIVPTAPLTLHGLRKCSISNWADSISNPEVVRKLAGHGDIATTMKFYGDASLEQKQKAAAAVEQLLTDARMTPEAVLGDFEG